jgi:tRNA (adenine22-N1)-methyltransferase
MPSIDSQKKLSWETRLPPRLMAVAGQVPACARVLDIGTDHAWLPIWLVRNGRCQAAVAIDNKEGPLRAAKSHILEAGLDDRIQVLQSNGLENVQTGPDDVLVLAGLGGYEIMDILGSSRLECKAIIIQAQKTLPGLRSWLSGHGYEITAEKLVRENGRFYVILSCQPAAGVQQFSPLEEWAGPVLLKENPPEYWHYLEKLRAHLYKKRRGMPELQSVIEQLEAFMETSGYAGRHPWQEGNPHE